MESYKNGGVLIKLIYINIAIFLLVVILTAFFKLMDFDFYNSWVNYIILSSDIKLLITQPWTIITFMFVHNDFFHFLFNLLLLYWSGKLFLLYFNQKQLVGLYLLGGLFAAVAFLLIVNVFPYFTNTGHVFSLQWSTGSALAILSAVTFYNLNMEIRLTLIGKVKLKYISIFFLVLCISVMLEKNTGEDLAHLGGLIAGYLFAMRIKKGKDLTQGVNRLLDFLADMTTRWHKPKFKFAKTTKEMTDSEWNAKKKLETEKLDSILDKIKHSGYSSLTEEEKNWLFEHSRK